MEQKPYVKNTSNESEVRSAHIKEKLKQESYENQLKFILQSEQGRAIIWKILGDCGIFKSSFTGSSETFFLEGKRSIGLSLLADLMRVDPNAFIKMQQEKREN